MSTTTKTALVCGGGGFIGSHLVKRLKSEGIWVRAVDLKRPEYGDTHADDFVVGDLREQSICQQILDRPFDEVYQLAADMGGAGYVFSGEHDADIMHNSATINLNIAHYGQKAGIKKLFYSSSACMYPEYNQLDPMLRATVSPAGDVNDKSTGLSIYPGNINHLVFRLEPYKATLDATHGAISEFVNPKYSDSTKTSFKSPHDWNV